MDRTYLDEEKIRKAEEILLRRKNYGIKLESDTVNSTQNKKSYILKKMFLQVLICALVYLSFYLVQNSNYVFSENVLTKIREVLAYDINIQEKVSTLLNNIKINSKKEIIIENSIDKNIILEENIIVENNVENIIIPKEVQMDSEKAEVKNLSHITLSEEETELHYIRENFSFIVPLKGKITSRYGIRNPTTITVPKKHTGIDIYGEIGAIIVAAMAGTVEEVENKGDYGKYFKIVNKDITTLYAHCNKIYVKKGQQVVQGEKIAEVGATGNVTGSHLHFEIRRNNKMIDPEHIINFGEE